MFEQTRFRFLKLFWYSAVFLASTWAAVQIIAGEPATSRNWWAFIGGDSDKPGAGYVLTETGGEITFANFFLFLPDSAENESGRFFHMSIIKQERGMVTADVKLFNGQKGPKGGEENHRVTFKIKDSFAASNRIAAEVTFGGSEGRTGKPVPVVFVLQGDQWK